MQFEHICSMLCKPASAQQQHEECRAQYLCRFAEIRDGSARSGGGGSITKRCLDLPGTATRVGTVGCVPAHQPQLERVFT